jgi:hypothetical protein
MRQNLGVDRGGKKKIGKMKRDKNKEHDFPPRPEIRSENFEVMVAALSPPVR